VDNAYALIYSYFSPLVSCLLLSLKSIAETIIASKKILSHLRNQSTYRKKNSKKAPATLSKAINKVGLVESSIRVNRVGGPMGHAGGMTMSDLRRATTSPYISNALPRNRSSANIVVPLQGKTLGRSRFVGQGSPCVSLSANAGKAPLIFW
jgi:hypothetical protein